MRRRTAVTAGLAAMALPAVVLAQGSQGPPYPLPTPTPTPVTPGPPAPRLGRSAVLQPVRGIVTYRTPRSADVLHLRAPARVPMGTLVDTKRGRVRVVVARDRHGHVWKSVFFDGRFRIEQAEQTGAVTSLTLAGGSFKPCVVASAARSRRRSHRRVRRLWGDGHGRFQTVGRFSAATVRGTRWLVEDRCDGTITRVARGVVTVDDFTVQPAPTPTPVPPASGTPAPGGGGGSGGGAPSPQQAPGKTVTVTKGHSYVAAPGG